ncbi:MAG TPA: bacteriohopanetetrol glucosamine biosynthesis glycosyltransferase HpnI [Candidatus Binataceae bacterium]|nr:bacteriohopanetetrol glucosamine biosynthesis glycosyltransferase HpnI [Candidatus Binataceae bacterium]
MSVLAIVALIGVGTSLTYYAVAAIAAMRFAHRAHEARPSLPKIAPRVAVLKPLRGRPEGLTANLTSYLEADYPRIEYYFAVSSYEDSATEVPVSLRAQYKFKPITLIVGEAPACTNRKVGKLIRMAERAERAEIFVLSDADIAISRDHLQHIVGELMADEKLGIVTCIYRARPLGSLASRLEALCVNTDFAPQVMISAAIEPIHYALGATIAIKREALAATGGFTRLKDVLADDYYLGNLVAKAGYTVKLSSSIVTTVCAEKTFADFWHHQMRWARTYKTTRPASLATILVHGPFWAILFLLAMKFSLLATGVFAVVILARVAMARLIIRRVLAMPELGRDAWLAPLKDLVMTAIWFACLTGNEVRWGERRLKILAGGVMREVPADAGSVTGSKAMADAE